MSFQVLRAMCKHTLYIVVSEVQPWARGSSQIMGASGSNRRMENYTDNLKNCGKGGPEQLVGGTSLNPCPWRMSRGEAGKMMVHLNVMSCPRFTFRGWRQMAMHSKRIYVSSHCNCPFYYILQWVELYPPPIHIETPAPSSSTSQRCHNIPVISDWRKECLFWCTVSRRAVYCGRKPWRSGLPAGGKHTWLLTASQPCLDQRAWPEPERMQPSRLTHSDSHPLVSSHVPNV